jgi:hypothetical protein
MFGYRSCPLAQISVSVLNTELGLAPHSNELYPFMRALGIADTRQGRRADLRIPRSRIDELKELRKDSLQFREAATKLGLPRKYVGVLIKSGLIRSIDIFPIHLISRSDVTRLLELTARVQAPTFNDVPEGMISVANVGKRFRAIALIISAILEGTVCIVGRLSGKSGFQSSLLNMMSVRKLITSARRRENLSCREAAKLLKLHRQIIPRLIKLGHLKSPSSVKRKRTTLTLEGIRSFKSEYMVAKRVGMHPTSVVSALEAEGIVGEQLGTIGRLYRRTRRFYVALAKLRQQRFKSRREAILSTTRRVLLEHGRPLRASDLAARIVEQGVSLPANRPASVVAGNLCRHRKDFVYIPGSGYWIVGAPLAGS